MPHDTRRIDVKAHAFAVGMVNLTCPCGWRETVARPMAEPTRVSHAAACASCQVKDDDAGAVLVLQIVTGATSGGARALLRAVRAHGYDITPKDQPV